MTPELKTKICAAMEKHGNKRSLAAAELGMSKVEFKDIINSNVDLRAVYGWKSKKVIHLAQPDGTVATLKLTEEQIAERNEKQFQSLVAPIFGNDKEESDTMALAKAYGRHSDLCEQVIGGSVFDRALKLKKLADEIDKELKTILAAGFVSVDPMTGEGAADNIAMNTRLRAITEFSINLHKQLISSAEMINKGRVANAKVRALRDAKNKSRGKLAFGPKQTNILAQHVQVNQGAS